MTADERTLAGSRGEFVASTTAGETARDDDKAIVHLLARLPSDTVRRAAKPRPEFSHTLLEDLKIRQRQALAQRLATQTPPADDRAEALLLARHHVPTEDRPCEEFAQKSLSAMRRRLAEKRAVAASAAPGAVMTETARTDAPSGPTPTSPPAMADDAEGTAMLLKHGYRPVDAAPQFRRRLLTEMRRRQRDTVQARRQNRRRVAGSFGLGAALTASAALALFGLAPSLAATVASDTPGYPALPSFVIETMPPAGAGGGGVAADNTFALALPPVDHVPARHDGGIDSGGDNASMRDMAALPALPPVPEAFDFQTLEPAAVWSNWTPAGASSGGGQLVPVGLGGWSGGNYGLASSRPLQQPKVKAPVGAGLMVELDRSAVTWPATRREEKVEVVDLDYRPSADAPWERIERGMVKLAMGAQFRTDVDDDRCGFAFEDGTRVSLLPNSRVTLSEPGFQVDRGSVTMAVPEQGKALAWHSEARDLAIEPGTTAMLEVGNPEGYAPGGAPAPRLSVASGGLALARGHGDIGIGALFPGQLYQLDHYVTAAIPGRPLCQGEADELAIRAPISTRAADGIALVSTDAPRCPTEHPAESMGYVRRDGKWVDPAFADGMTATKLRHLSPEFLNLLRTRRDLVDFLALGPGVVFRDGEAFFEIDN